MTDTYLLLTRVDGYTEPISDTEGRFKSSRRARASMVYRRVCRPRPEHGAWRCVGRQRIWRPHRHEV